MYLFIYKTQFCRFEGVAIFFIFSAIFFSNLHFKKTEIPPKNFAALRKFAKKKTLIATSILVCIAISTGVRSYYECRSSPEDSGI